MDAPRIPSPWYFHNLEQGIYDAKCPFSANSFARASDENTTYSTSSLRKTIVPDLQWQAFSPNDNLRIDESDGSHVPVGFDRLLFEVVDKSKLRPIYWPIPFTAHVHKARWVFSSSFTPIHPAWDETVCLLWETVNWSEYAATLEKAIQDESVLAQVVHRESFEQDNRPLSFNLLFSKDGSKVYLFSGKDGSVNTAALKAVLEGECPRGTIESFEGFDWDVWKQLRNVTNVVEDPTYTPPPVTHLILAFHGIGQKLSDSYNRVNFVYAIDKLRVNVANSCDRSDVSAHLPENTSFLVLAVNWRQAISFDTDYSLESITVPSIPWLRQAINDAMIDIPLYMCDDHSRLMLNAAATEANRIYSLVVKNHPGFDKFGKVHLIGHSLGSLIAADLLSRQPLDCSAPEAPFKFSTTNFFTTGSPLGLFLLLRKRHIEPRRSDSPREFGCFAVRNLYNIVHPSDMVCLRLDPTVKGGNLGAEPLPLPPWIEPSVTTSRLSVLSSGKRRMMSWVRRYSELAEGEEIPPGPKEPEPDLDLEKLESPNPYILELNDNGQIDWIINPPGGALGNQWIKIFTAHFEYWSNKEFARFIAIECGRRPGTCFTAKEHRARWMFEDREL